MTAAPITTARAKTLVAAAALFFTWPLAAQAQPYLPAPGGAPGADTGDAPIAFAGLAEIPGADLFTGSATTRIVIDVPPGRRGATPAIALHYSSNGGPSPYGYGWSLPIPRVSRSTKRGVPRFDDSDMFVLSLGPARVELEPEPGTPRYRAKIEGSYLRIGFDTAANRWRVIDKSGTTYEFGSTPDSRLGPATERDAGTSVWMLERSVDPFGNHVDYEYLVAARGEGLPVRIRYGGNLRAGLEHAFEVRFDWALNTYPTLPVVSHRAGYEATQSRLLLAIETRTPVGLARRYSLSHDVDGGTGHARLVGVSLDGFTEKSGDEVALPSTVFVYADAAPHDWPLGTETQRRSKALVFASPGTFRDIGARIEADTFDIDGDAIVDYVSTKTSPPSVRRGHATGFGPAEAWPWPATARRIRKIDSGNDITTNVFDLTGDGLPDLVDSRESECGTDTWCVYRNNGAGFEPTPIRWAAHGNRIRGTDIEGKTVRTDVADLDGDGRLDLVDATVFSVERPYWHIYRNSGRGFARVPTRFSAPANAISRSAIELDRSFLLQGLHDMNGDGLPDFVRADVSGLGSPLPLSQSHWDVYLNTGTGFALEPVQWRVEGTHGIRLSNFISSHLIDPASERAESYEELVDMNGDGRLDWVRQYNGADYLAFGLEPLPCTSNPCSSTGSALPPQCCFRALVFLNTGSSFSAPTPWAAWHDVVLRSYSRATNNAAREFDLLDFDGDGLIDLVEREDGEWRVFRHPASPLGQGGSASAFRRYRPNLLVAMMNGVGGQTRLEYSSVAALRGNRLPYPAWVLTNQEVFDGLQAAPAGSTSFQYRHAAYDAEDAEFRGFGLVWQEDAGKRPTATTFHQDDTRAGLVESISLLETPTCAAADPLDPEDPCSSWNKPIEVRENAWPESSPVLLASRLTTPFHRGTAIPELAKHLEYAYDAYGNVIAERVSSPSAAIVETTTEYAYGITDTATGLPSRYIVDRPLRSATRDLAAPEAPLTEKRYTYDADPPRTGAIASAETCIEWARAGCVRWQRFEYRSDKFGNVSAIRGPAGAMSTFRYDPLALYASVIRNALGAETQVTRELAGGKQTRTILPDGRVLETDYDGIGRPLRHYRSGSDASGPEIVSTYFEGTPGSLPSWVRSEARGSGPAVVFHDGLGRLIAKKAWVDTADGVRAVVSGFRRYGPAGEILAESLPFPARSSTLTVLDDTAGNAHSWTEYLRDSQGRLIETRFADGSRTLHDTSVPGVRVTVDPNLAGGEHPGAARIEILDGFGRVWRRDMCAVVPSARSANTCPAASLLARSEYEHDALDRVVKTIHGVETSTHAIVDTAYDGLGNRTRYASSNLGTWTYSYDDVGYMIAAVDPRGARVANHYDKLGRLRRQIAADVRASYRYHRRGMGTGLVRRISSKTAQARVSKTFAYDQRGRTTQELWKVRASGEHHQHTIAYAYDSADRRTSVTYPSATEGAIDTLRTEYTPYGLPFALHLESETETTELVRAVSYDIYGNTTRIDYGNDLSDRYRYGDALHRLRCVRTAHYLASGDACSGQSSDVRRRWVATRDRSGNPLGIIDFRYAGTALDRSVSYAYDALGRMVAASHASEGTENFAYDGIGNLTFDTNSGPFTYTPGAPNIASSAGSVALSHDAAGNRTGKGPWSYLYDSLGRLTEIRRSGTLVTAHHYDEGRSRVVSEVPLDGTTTFHFGGFFDVHRDRIVRYYYLGGRLVATDAIPITHRRRPEASYAGLAVLLLATPLWLVARSPRRVTALLTTAAVLISSVASPASAGSHAIRYLHHNEIGSPELITDETGAPVEHLLYASYGRIRALFDGSAHPQLDRVTDIGFNGHRDDSDTGLVYFGARYYDPALGLFLTPDPQAQYTSPYLHGGGNPVYAADPDGEALLGFLIALVEPLLASAIASSFVSAVAAAASGGDIAGAAIEGLVAGGAGAAIGTTFGAANIGYQLAAGGAQYIEVGEALAATLEVARRSAFTTAVAHAASATTNALGGNSDWATVASVGMALAGSYAYDGYVVKDSGGTFPGGHSQRAVARDGIRQVNTRIGHANVTEEASVGTGWGHQATSLMRSNVAQDGTGGFLSRLRTVLNNQEHFGRLPSTMPKITGAIDSTIEGSASELLGVSFDIANGPLNAYTRAVGGATHYVQDHLTVGHMVPGTSLFSGPIGAPIRFVIHQVFGGEVAFRDAQIRATRSLLTHYGPAL